MKKKKKTFLSVLLWTLALGLGIRLAKGLPFYLSGREGPAETAAALLSPEYVRGLFPLFAILTLACAGVILSILFLRAHLHKPSFHPARTDRGKRKAGTKALSRFMALRWIILTAFSFLMIFSGTLFGLKLGSLGLPVLSCPWNRGQLMEASCYYLSHPEKLLELPLGEIAVFLASTLGFALLLGRVLCGFLCPMGLIQDGLDLLRRKARIEGIAPNEHLTQRLVPVRWALVLLFLGVCFVGGDFCTFCPAISVSPFLAGMGASLYLSGFVCILVLIGSFFKRRLWCQVCPLGYLVGLLHKASLFKIEKDGTACTECGACYEACPMGIRTIYTEREKPDVTDATCIFCGECIRRCPEDNALQLTLASHPLYRASRLRLMRETYGKMGEEP